MLASESTAQSLDTASQQQAASLVATAVDEAIPLLSENLSVSTANGGHCSIDQNLANVEVPQTQGPKRKNKLKQVRRTGNAFNKKLKTDRGENDPGSDDDYSKEPWSAEEDMLLRAQIKIHGKSNWSRIAAAIPRRSGKSCRLRWCNELDPEINKGPYTELEDAAVIALREQHGNKWAFFAKQLPGRTDNSVKNRWNSTLSKHLDEYRKTNRYLRDKVALDIILTELRQAAGEVSAVESDDENDQHSYSLEPISLPTLEDISPVTREQKSCDSKTHSQLILKEPIAALVPSGDEDGCILKPALDALAGPSLSYSDLSLEFCLLVDTMTTEEVKQSYIEPAVSQQWTDAYENTLWCLPAPSSIDRQLSTNCHCVDEADVSGPWSCDDIAETSFEGCIAACPVSLNVQQFSMSGLNTQVSGEQLLTRTNTLLSTVEQYSPPLTAVHGARDVAALSDVFDIPSISPADTGFQFFPSASQVHGWKESGTGLYSQASTVGSSSAISYDTCQAAASESVPCGSTVYSHGQTWVSASDGFRADLVQFLSGVDTPEAPCHVPHFH